MFKTHEIPIGPIFRFFLGTLGIVVVGTGLILSVRAVWSVFQGEWLSLLSTLLFLMITAGGVSLLRSAIRGRLPIRSYGVKNKM